MLVLSQRSSMIQTDKNKDNANLNIHQKKMLQTVVKQTLLSCMILAIALLYIAISITILSIHSTLDENRSSVLIDVQAWLDVFPLNAVTLCQYLTFAVNAACYHKLCSKCHIKCDHLCQSTAAKHMNIDDYFVYLCW